VIAALDLAGWLKSKGVDEEFDTDGHIPSRPDRRVIISGTGGPGESGERTRDALSFQVRTRGRQNVPGDAEQLAWQVDDAIMGAIAPLSINGTRVISIQRQGGPPGFILRDTARRAHFSCNYLFTVARTVF
jgi:hypothetical protein